MRDMHPYVRFRLSDGRSIDLAPGDLIGRSERAALFLSDPFISEAHAMVSLRSGELRLLALRGRFSVDGKPASQVVLRAGQRVVLASRRALLVEDVVLPAFVFGLDAPGLSRTIIAPVVSVRCLPTLEVQVGFLPDADLHLWMTGTRLHTRQGEGASREVKAGDAITVGGCRLTIVAIPIGDLSHAPTENASDVGVPLHIIVNYDTVHVIAGPQRLTFDGIGARILSELAAVKAPIAWQEIARMIWGREAVLEEVLRERWDSSIGRLRRKLKEARVRDLVHATRNGHVELVLGPGDTLEDRQ